MATEAVSGPGRQLAAIAPRLAEKDIHLRVLLFQRDPDRKPPFAAYLKKSGVAHEIIRDRGPLDWRMVGAVRRRLDAAGATVVQTHGYKATAIGYALRRARRARPWIGFFHGATDKGWKDSLYQALEQRLLLAADRVVVVNRQQFAQLHTVRSKVRVIDNAAIPLPPDEPRERAAIDETIRFLPRPLFGVIGRLSPEKGVDTFLHACDELRAKGLEFSGLIVGDGPEEARLRQLARDLQIQDRIVFLGRVESVGAVLRHLDLLVLPSRSEGLPNVLLEGLSAGLPVVATNVGAIPEVLRDSRSGTVLPPDDPSALAAAMIAVEGESPGEMAVEARRATLERYSIERRVEDHVRLYHDITAFRRDTGRTLE